MRNMSFAMTVDQLLDGTKDVTRRMGWAFLKPGDEVCAVRKAMGLRKGEAIERLARIRVVSVRREPLDAITPEDVGREGYRGVGYSPNWFVAKFCKAMRCNPGDMVTRIEFTVESYYDNW